MKTFYLLRYGESEANANRIFAAKDPPLIERGIKQAAMQAEMLKQSNNGGDQNGKSGN